MLKLNPDPTFTIPVELSVPGQEKTESLAITFKYRGRKELEAFWAAVGKKSKNKNVEVFMDMVEGWNWPDVEFTAENVEKFLDNYPVADTEIATAYSKALVVSRVKN